MNKRGINFTGSFWLLVLVEGTGTGGYTKVVRKPARVSDPGIDGYNYPLHVPRGRCEGMRQM